MKGNQSYGLTVTAKHFCLVFVNDLRSGLVSRERALVFDKKTDELFSL